VLKDLWQGTTGLSQEDPTEASETDQTYVLRQERGERCPNLWVILLVSPNFLTSSNVPP